MNKQDLIAKIAKDVDLSKSTAGAAVESFFDTVTKALKKGDSITFVGFGTFKTSQRKARTARNPQTGAAIRSQAPRGPFQRRQDPQDTVKLPTTRAPECRPAGTPRHQMRR